MSAYRLIRPRAIDRLRWPHARSADGGDFAFAYAPPTDPNVRTLVIQPDGGFPRIPWHSRTPLKAVKAEGRAPWEKVRETVHDVFVGPRSLLGITDAGRAFIPQTWDMYAGRKTGGTLQADGRVWYWCGAYVMQAVFEWLRDHGWPDYDPDLKILLGGLSGGALGIQQSAHLAAGVWPTVAHEGRLRLLMDSGMFHTPPAGYRVPTLTGQRSVDWAVNHVGRVYGVQPNPKAVARLPEKVSVHHAMLARYALPALYETEAEGGLNLPTLVIQPSQDGAYPSLFTPPKGATYAEWENAVEEALIGEPVGWNPVEPAGQKHQNYTLCLAYERGHVLSHVAPPELAMPIYDTTLPQVARNWWNGAPGRLYTFTPDKTFRVPRGIVS